ncbi:hypothetical protein [Bosea sp. RAC05]|uniref:hypothetical protein n=1 Tax=Bosea sp. RAC05 TaxID=1842539 RepID=UPI00083D62B2|nr:hypothetical protein [Bosea sp. RAC05]AOG02950.1 hypothetical protein BSY19_5355 [Bosea sp. RAC05]
MSDASDAISDTEAPPVPRPHRERSDIKPFVPDADRAAIYRAMASQIEIGGSVFAAAVRIREALVALGSLPSASDRRQREFRLIFVDRIVEALADDQATFATELKVVADLCPAEFLGAFVRIADLKEAREPGRFFARMAECVNRAGV